MFDLPGVVPAIEGRARLDIVAGDFFADPLPTCDAYLLMQVVHDWNDTEAETILTAVARAATDSATVLLLEWLLPEDNQQPHAANSLDVMMLTTTGGRERTRTQYGLLLETAGIDLVAVHTTPSALSIGIEGRIRPAP